MAEVAGVEVGEEGEALDVPLAGGRGGGRRRHSDRSSVDHIKSFLVK
jgi:hypothetical protein